MSEFESTSLKEFLLIKLLDRDYHLFGWRFGVNRYTFIPFERPRFYIDRFDEPETGEVIYALGWFTVSRWPHSEKRKAAWRARFKAVEAT